MPATRVLLELDLAAEVDSVAVARERTRAALVGQPDLEPVCQDDLELLVSELVSNALKHGHPEPFSLCVSRDASVVRLCVTNPGRAFSPSAERPRDGGGFGFMMVRALCSRWGVDPSGREVSVWVEYPVR